MDERYEPKKIEPHFQTEWERATATVFIQVNGKVRERLQVHAGADADEVKALALASEGVKRHLVGQLPHKFIFVQDKLLSIVV
ncbi:MAG: hypothetical protein ACLQAT_17715 [Candidatus Binataceae bacterium]